jgi:hypothetical protein
MPAFVHLHAYLHLHMYTCMCTNIPAMYVHTSLHWYIRTYMNTYIHACALVQPTMSGQFQIHTRAFLHIHITTYIHTYLHLHCSNPRCPIIFTNRLKQKCLTSWGRNGKTERHAVAYFASQPV